MLQKILRFSPGEAAAVNAKIDYYSQSWWHRTGNALKREGGGSHASVLWASVFGGNEEAAGGSNNRPVGQGGRA